MVGIEVLISPSLSVGSLLIGAIGILAGIYVSQGLKATALGTRFKALIFWLSGSMCASFIIGGSSIWMTEHAHPAGLETILLYVFLAVLLTTAVGVSAAVIHILD